MEADENVAVEGTGHGDEDQISANIHDAIRWHALAGRSERQDTDLLVIKSPVERRVKVHVEF